MITSLLPPARYHAEQVFGLKGKGLGDKNHDAVVGYSASNTPFSFYIPEKDPAYCFRRELLRDLLAWHRLKNGTGLYLTGETGTGKTSFIEQFCARIGMPLFTAIGHQAMEIQDLIGGLGVKDGGTFFQEGPLTTALRHGFWFLLNEVDLLNPGTATSLNEILDGRGLTISQNGTFIKIHPYFRFIVTGNTLGNGMSQHYIGTQRMNLAFLDRFIKVDVQYPSEDEEAEVLKKVLPDMAEDLIRKMLKMANKMRLAFQGKDKEGDTSNVTMSTRSLITWGKFSLELGSLHKEPQLQNVDATNYEPMFVAFERVVLNQADESTRASLISAYHTIFS